MARAIATGDAAIVFVGGVEPMTRAPWVFPGTREAYVAGDATLLSTKLGWRLVNPQMPALWRVPLGQVTEQLAAKCAIERDGCDELTARSNAPAARDGSQAS